MSCWCTLFGKYSSNALPFIVSLPLPGTRRMRTTAFLRRPTVWIGRSSEANTGAGASPKTSAPSSSSVSAKSPESRSAASASDCPPSGASDVTS